MNPLYVGIDVSSKNNVAYLMKPDGSKHSSFSVQNNLGGAKLLSERIVSALGSMQLERVVIGLEATSIYGDSLCSEFLLHGISYKSLPAQKTQLPIEDNCIFSEKASQVMGDSSNL